MIQIQARSLNGRGDDPIRLSSDGVLHHPYPYRLDVPPPWEGVPGNHGCPLTVVAVPPGQRAFYIEIESPAGVRPPGALVDDLGIRNEKRRYDLKLHAYRHEIDSPWGRCWSTIVAAYCPEANAWIVSGEPEGQPAERLCPDLMTGRPSTLPRRG